LNTFFNLKKIKLGLCRVTFRKSDPLSILKICKKSGIEGIEWGGDIHSPIGDITQAKYINNYLSA